MNRPKSAPTVADLQEWFKTARDTHAPSVGAIPPEKYLSAIVRWLEKEAATFRAEQPRDDAYREAATLALNLATTLDKVIALEDWPQFKKELSDIRSSVLSWPWNVDTGRPPATWQHFAPKLLRLIDRAADATPGNISDTARIKVIAKALDAIGVDVPDAMSMVQTLRKHGELSKAHRRAKTR